MIRKSHYLKILFEFISIYLNNFFFIFSFYFSHLKSNKLLDYWLSNTKSWIQQIRLRFVKEKKSSKFCLVLIIKIVYFSLFSLFSVFDLTWSTVNKFGYIYLISKKWHLSFIKKNSVLNVWRIIKSFILI